MSGYDINVSMASSQAQARPADRREDFELPPIVDTWSGWFALAKACALVDAMLVMGLVIRHFCPHPS